MGERVATLEQWASGHDKVCGDRYRLLLAAISAGASIIVGVAAWGLNQVHEDQARQMQLLQSVSQQVTTSGARQRAPVTVQMNQTQ